MSGIGLRLGPLHAAGFVVQRSGVTWLCDDGHACRANEVIAYCNISLERAPGQRTAAVNPFADERELQVAFAPPVAGRLRKGGGAAPGGHLGVHGVQPWRSGDVLGFLDAADERSGADAGPLRLMVLAGRRMTALAAVETGLLAGWHGRTRAWWSDPAGTPGPTLLSLGICDSNGPVRGDQGAFLEMFEAAPFPAQVVHVADQPLTPCAPLLAEQFARTQAQLQAIAADLRSALLTERTIASADDWLFAGALLAGIGRSPMNETYSVLTAAGLLRTGPADAILLSLNAEFPTILRHKRLGHHLHVMRHHQMAAGPAIRAWLAASFEPVRRRVDDVKRDYERLFDLVSAETGARFLVINRMSSSGQEDVTSYAAFDAPMSDTLETIAAKELNLMLHDLAESRDVQIIDVDAIAGELGAAAHLPDGMHQSGLMQSVMREEISRCLG